MVTIRKAIEHDVEEITKIYNEAILKTVATFDTKPKTIEEQITWFKNHGSKNPILVAVENKNVIGWAALSIWSDRCAYSDTAEISLYVYKKHQKKGVGRKLLEEAIKEGQKAGIHTVIARITEGNESSVHLHESVGFFNIGIMREVGFKFNKRLDVYIMQKIYPD